MKIWSLASGSSGNCYLIQDGHTLVLIDAGISGRKILHEIGRLGFDPSRLAAILVTHEHVDHWVGATAIARRYDIPVVCTPGTFQAAKRGPRPVPLRSICSNGSLSLDGLTVHAFPVPHDASDPVGFLVRSREASVCVATDMGSITEAMLEHAREADLVILESNHDEDMLLRGPYSWSLKERILGHRGHLSNAAAGSALVQLATARPQIFWLAHLSSTNNSPAMALAAARDTLMRAGLSRTLVGVALRDRRSLHWNSEAVMMEQLPLF